MTDPKLKTIREVVYYILDARPTAPHPVYGIGYTLDEEGGDSIVSTDTRDLLTFISTGEVVEVRRDKYVYKTNRYIQVKRKTENSAAVVAGVVQEKRGEPL